MGFSLEFVRIAAGGTQVDSNRAAVAAFLDERGLQVVKGQDRGALVDSRGEPLRFDDRTSELYLSPLEELGPMEGGIHHATLSDEECLFIFDLCAVAGFLIVNPQGNPMFVVPQHNHAPNDVPAPDDVAWVGTAEDMGRALTGSFDEFRLFRDRVVLQAHAYPASTVPPEQAIALDTGISSAPSTRAPSTLPSPPAPALSAPRADVPTSTNALAIVSFISAFFIGLVAVVTGHIALKQIRQTGQEGRGLAIAGLIIGYTALAITTLIFAPIVVAIVSGIIGAIIKSLS